MRKRNNYPLVPRAERFRSHVQKTRTCWLWTGVTADLRGGYGVFYDDDQRLRRAHRVAYELAHGVTLSDPSVKVRHKCDNPPCVRPAHLILGTQGQNLGDMRTRKRGSEPPHSRGVERYNAKLTDEVIVEMRARHAAGESYSSLARECGVSRPCLTYAIKGETWAHVAQ